MTVFAQFSQGRLFANDNDRELGSLPWNEHPKFKGVFLKDLLKRDETADLFSLHLVRLEAEKEIGLHRHADSLELHEVLGGSGYCEVEGRRIEYLPGRVALIACNAEHRVVAGPEGLCLFAKFIRER